MVLVPAGAIAYWCVALALSRVAYSRAFHHYSRQASAPGGIPPAARQEVMLVAHQAGFVGAGSMIASSALLFMALTLLWLWADAGSSRGPRRAAR